MTAETPEPVDVVAWLRMKRVELLRKERDEARARVEELEAKCYEVTESFARQYERRAEAEAALAGLRKGIDLAVERITNLRVAVVGGSPVSESELHAVEMGLHFAVDEALAAAPESEAPPSREAELLALDDIRHERARQVSKWGDQSFKNDEAWACILGEEAGECAKAVIEGGGELRKELVQTAAVCVAWIEALESRGLKLLPSSINAALAPAAPGEEVGS